MFLSLWIRLLLLLLLLLSQLTTTTAPPLLLLLLLPQSISPNTAVEHVLFLFVVHPHPLTQEHPCCPTSGSVVQVGAFDGNTYSNTRFFDQELGWTGVLIEAEPSNFAKVWCKPI